MTTIPFAGFTYNGLTNLGDHIQSICTERLLPKIETRFNRDSLNNVQSTSKYLMIMNGWFTHEPRNFPPSATICPFFWGFHITDWNDSWSQMSSSECLSYFNAHVPIGCRDRYTQQRLNDIGVNAFYSKCLTLTFPLRPSAPRKGWNILVDVNVPLPEFIEDNSIRVTHQISPNVSEHTKFTQATKLLELYRDHASLIVTTRLHCALPAVAMGIPVVFLGDPLDYRISILGDIGLKINKCPVTVHNKAKFVQETKQLWSEVDWDPKVIEFENEKQMLIKQFNAMLHARMEQFQ